MLALEPEAYSLKHYRKMLGPEFLGGGGYAIRGMIIGAAIAFGFVLLNLFFGDSKERSIVSIIVSVVLWAIIGLVIGKFWGIDGEWITPIKNSFKIAIPATLLSVSLGTLAAIGLSQSHVPF